MVAPYRRTAALFSYSRDDEAAPLPQLESQAAGLLLLLQGDEH